MKSNAFMKKLEKLLTVKFFMAFAKEGRVLKMAHNVMRIHFPCSSKPFCFDRVGYYTDIFRNTFSKICFPV